MKEFKFSGKFKSSEQGKPLKEGKKKEITYKEQLTERANELFKEIQRHKVFEEKFYKTPRTETEKEKLLMRSQQDVALRRSEEELKKIVDKLKKVFGIEWSPPQEE